MNKHVRGAQEKRGVIMNVLGSNMDIHVQRLQANCHRHARTQGSEPRNTYQGISFRS